MGVMILLIAAVVLYVWYLISKEFYNIADMKGHGDTKYLWLTFFLGLVGALLVIALPDHGKTQTVVIRPNDPVTHTPQPSDELPEL